MLALPTLAATPRAYTTAANNPLAAQMVLALAGDADLPRFRKLDDAPELRALEAQLAEWLKPRVAGLSHIRPKLHLALNQAPDEAGASETAYTLWIGNRNEDYLGSVWTLERRWRTLEQSAPGLAAAALGVLGHAGVHSFSIYTPGIALDWAQEIYWMGEVDERYVLEEYRAQEDDENAKLPAEVLTRAAIDKAMPPHVTRPSSRRASIERLTRHRRADVARIAELVLAIRAFCNAAHRRDTQATRRKQNFDLQSVDENGFTAMGFACCLRWNMADPMFRIFDDHGNQLAESEGTSDRYGWIVGDSAKELPAMLEALAHRFTLARLVDELLPLVATRVGR